MHRIVAAACAWLLLAGSAAAQQPLGIVVRFDPDTLAPAGAGIDAAETHTPRHPSGAHTRLRLVEPPPSAL